MPDWQAAAAGLLVAVPAAVCRRSWASPTTSRCSCCSARWRCGCVREACVATDAPSPPAASSSAWPSCLATMVSCWALPFALAFLYDLLRSRGPRASAGGPALLCAGGFMLVVAPWLLRQLDVFGSISPSSVGRTHPLHHRVPRALQRHHRDDAGVVPVAGARRDHREPPGWARGALCHLRGACRCWGCWCRCCSSAHGSAGAVGTSRPGSSTWSRCSPSPRSSRPSTCPSAPSSTRPWPWCRTPTCWSCWAWPPWCTGWPRSRAPGTRRGRPATSASCWWA